MRTRVSLWVIVAAMATLLGFVMPPQLRPSHFLPDDSYFYLQIADNIATGRGATFHQITPTNGFHPLWMWFCVVVDFLCGHDKRLFPSAIFLVQTLLATGTGILFRAVSSRIAPGVPWISLSILASYFLTGMYGSEAHINGFCVISSIYLLALTRERPQRLVLWALVGVALGLTFLARLDNVFVVSALAGLTLIRAAAGGPSAFWKRSVAVLVPAGVMVLPYLVSNVMEFGHVVPISGAIKSSLPVVSFRLSNLGLLGAATVAAALTSLGLVVAGGIAPQTRGICAALSLGVLVHALYVACLTDPGIPWSWYWVPGVLNTGLLIAAITARMPLRAYRVSRARINAAIAIAIVLLGLSRSWLRYRDAEAAGVNRFTVRRSPIRERWQRALGLWLKAHVPRGSGVFVYDQPGAIAYYSDLRVLPADGLVSDFRYNDEIVRLGIAGYLGANGVGYYVGPIVGNDSLAQVVPVRAPLTGKGAGVLRLEPRDLIIRVADISRSAPAWALWRLSGPR